MSNELHGSREPHDSRFIQEVDQLIGSLVRATRLGAGAPTSRSIFKRGAERAVAEAERELERFRDGLLRLHGELDGHRRTQLKREVAGAIRAVNTELAAHESYNKGEGLWRPVNGPDTAKLRTRVREALNPIIPSDAVAPGVDHVVDRRPDNSLLPRPARALAHGVTTNESIGAYLDTRKSLYWKEQFARKGVEETMRAIEQEVGGDPLAAVRFATEVQGGPVLGYELDPVTRERRGLVTVDADHSGVILGRPGTGKTTGVLVPNFLMKLARGHNGMMVTPHAATLGAALPTGKALTGQENVTVIDFGGEVISEDSERFVTWDVTRTCLTEEGATWFADTFAGETLPAYKSLSNPQYWGGIVWNLYRSGSHIAAAMRQLHGRDEHLNGMARVYDLIKTPTEDSIPKELPASTREAVAHDPEQLKLQERLFEGAKRHADTYHPRLRQIAFQAYILTANGVPLDDDIVGQRLRDLSDQLYYVDNAATEGEGDVDPLIGVLNTFKLSLTKHEVRVMSPHGDDLEVDSKDFIRPNAGLSFVTYSQTASKGVAPGAFTSQVIAAAVQQNRDHALSSWLPGHAERLARFTIAVDEAEGAAEQIPLLADVFTNYRQLGISGLLAATSIPQLEKVFPDNVGKFLEAPFVIDFSPNPARATELAGIFGKQVVWRPSRSQNVGEYGGSRSESQDLEDRVTSYDLGNLKRGTAVVEYLSREEEGDKYMIVEIPQLMAPDCVVGGAVNHVIQAPEQYEPMSQFVEVVRPDLAKRVALQRDPTAALGAGTPAAFEAAIAEPEEDLSAVAKRVTDPALEPGAEAVQEPAARPGRPAVDADALARALADPENLAKVLSELIESGQISVSQPAEEPADTAAEEEPGARGPAEEPADRVPADRGPAEEPADTGHAAEPAKEPADTAPAEDAADRAPAEEPAEEPADTVPGEEPADIVPAKNAAEDPAREVADDSVAEPAKDVSGEPAKEAANEPARDVSGELAKKAAEEPAREPAPRPVNAKPESRKPFDLPTRGRDDDEWRRIM